MQRDYGDYEPPRIHEARGEVVVSGRSVSIDIEYQDAEGRWRKPPINGIHKVDWVLPDDVLAPPKALPKAPSK